MSNSTLEAPETAPLEYPHLRADVNGTPIGSVLDSMTSTDKEMVRVDTGRDIVISPDGETVMVGTREVPVDEESMALIGAWAGVPDGFFKKMPPPMRVEVINRALRDIATEPGRVRIANGRAIEGIIGLNQIPFDPAQIVEVAANVLGERAPVIDISATAKTFSLDVVTTPDHFRDLGDPRIGDITKAGLRFSMKTAQNLAPIVNPYYYRLWCTNGCSSIHDETKLDARGLSVDEVMFELESKARLAFGMVESEVAAMYDLRNEPLPDPTGAVNRMAREAGLSDRWRQRLVDELPSFVDDVQSMTMFDAIQAATNLANSPEVPNQGVRNSLQEMGSQIITDHASRCQSCHSLLH